jgi:hypothetical protein
MFLNYDYSMTDKKTYRDILTPTIEETGDGMVRVIFYMGDVEMVCLYYERAKKGWTNKPIMPQAWRCVDSKISNTTIYIQGLIEPKELVGWGQELIKGAGL